jgi:hypothetical protein
MITRLVEEHDVGGGQKEFRQEDSSLLAAAECFQGPAMVLRAKPETIEDFLDLVINRVSVMVAKQFIESIVSGGEGLVFGLVGGNGERLGRANHVVMGSEKFGEGALGLIEERTTGGKSGMLFEHTNTGAGMETDLAGIRLIQAGEQPHQSRFAGAIRPNQSRTFAVIQLEAQIFKQRLAIESTGQLRATQ